MSDIARFVTIWGGGGMMPANNGNYVRYDDHRAEVERLTAERDVVRAERDAAQRERERVQDLLWLRGRELPTLQRDQPAQNLDMANGQAILDSSRPDDETIWREAFMRFIEEKNAVECADIRLAEYRKRWPR